MAYQPKLDPTGLLHGYVRANPKKVGAVTGYLAGTVTSKKKV